MQANERNLWSDVLGQVRLNHPDLVRGWFEDLQPAGLEHGVLRVKARNSAQVRYLQQHCTPVFAEAAQAATGRLVAVIFETDAAEDETSSLHGRPVPGLEEPLDLIPEFTFDNFVTGPCNRLAHAAAVATANDPGRAYNPLFLHSPVGLGKTHLMQAVCHAITANRPGSRVLYISCETFINHFIEAVEEGALNRFRYRYRHVDGLVIDDIQFLAERERSQEEFFHTFNTLHQSRRQIILSADCAPSEIPSLEERLVSRFNSGLVALLDRPCLETRMAIVRKKAKLRCIEVPEDVIRLIGSSVESNIRELEGALLKVDALSQTRGGVITFALAEGALGLNNGRIVKVSVIQEVVARRFGVKVTDLQGKKRSKDMTLPRHVSMYLARQHTALSLQEIGGYFGGRDHSTVLHGSRMIAEQIKQNKDLARQVQELAMEVKHSAH